MLPSPYSRRLTLALLSAALPAVAVAALCSGALEIAPAALLRALLSPLGLTDADSGLEAAAVLQLRLPRVLTGLLVGAALAQAGASMQGLFRNPLADPGLVGVSAGAALGAAASLSIAAHWLPQAAALPWLTPAAAFAGGLAATWAAARVAEFEGRLDAATLLLAGLAINAVAGAGLGFILTVADSEALRSISFWMFGSLGRADWQLLRWLAPPLLAILLWLPREAGALDAMLLGDAEAQHLGIDAARLKWRVLALVALAVACSVALCGLIGFVGLLVPHLMRLAGGAQHRWLLGASALGGALLLSLADLVARLAIAPQEIPVGIVTALLGGPFFLALLLRHRRGLFTA